MKSTGFKDIDKKEIFEGDFVNIFFTSNNEEYIHDCIYKTQFGIMGDVIFKFVKLSWENYGHNQFTLHTVLSQNYNNLSYKFIEDEAVLIVPECKSIDESLYFKKVNKIEVV
ncbi:MAG: hypothetical protein GY870_09550 [archaeon]|nr:hypothetical protein [archaeon]